MPWKKKRPATATATIPLTDQWRTDVDSSVVAYRSGDVVTVAAWRLAVLADIVGEVIAYELPHGYCPPPGFVDDTRDSRGARVYLSNNNRVAITDPSRSVSHHSFTFVTLDPMPAGGA